jgi:hypothetical protein
VVILSGLAVLVRVISTGIDRVLPRRDRPARMVGEPLGAPRTEGRDPP